MDASHYLQLTAIGQCPMDVINRVFTVLHGVRQSHSLVFALAFPQMKTGNRPHPGNVVQVFSDNVTLDAVVAELRLNNFIIDYVHVSRVKPVPDDVNTYSQYALFRVPNRNVRTQQNRINRLTDAEQLPYVKVASKSNGQIFSLRIKRTSQDNPSASIEPNSYGLAVSTRPFALPDIPVS